MTDANHAPLNTQLGDEPCLVEDSADMFCLRESDDYQSRFRLGNALAAQYRFKEALSVYQSALRIRSDDWKLYNCLGGVYLTLRRFDEAFAAYRNEQTLKK